MDITYNTSTSYTEAMSLPITEMLAFHDELIKYSKNLAEKRKQMRASKKG